MSTTRRVGRRAAEGAGSLLPRNVRIGQAAFSTARGAIWTLMAFGLPFLLYLRTLAPTVYGLDSAELTTGAYVLGIVHPPGSPLFLLIGHVFSWIPIGDVGYRLNLLSATASALTSLLMYLVIRRLIDDRVVALGTTWFLAATYYFWVNAVAAELYALHTVFIAALLWLGLRWRDEEKRWQLYAFALVFGLGLGNHLSLILLAPGFAVLVLSSPNQPWRQPLRLAPAVLWGLLGASVYLYLPIRYLAHPSLDYARDYLQFDLSSWPGFWSMVSARSFSSLMFGVPLPEVPGELLQYLVRLWSNFLGLGLLIGLVGLGADARRRPTLNLAFGVMFIGHLAFYVPYPVIDKEVMFTPTYLIWGVWMGMGLQALRDRLAPILQDSPAVAMRAAVLLLAASAIVLNFRYVDLSQDWSARERGQRILETLEPNAYFFGTWADIPILEYLQIVEQERTDVKLVNMLFTSSARGSSIATEMLRKGYPVYTSTALLSIGHETELVELASCACFQLTLAAHPS
jgi:hypothetical protein